MRHNIVILLAVAVLAFVAAQSTEGILGLIQRRLPDHVDRFELNLTSNETFPSTMAVRNVTDEYTVSSTANSTILIEGNSLSALASGLHRYLTDELHVDIFWNIGSRLDVVFSEFPNLNEPLTGSSIVSWRYHFNTVTFSYTAAFWTWDDWELQLDWMALRGVNLPLAWVGQEKILVDTFREFGFTDAEISTYLSGPAFQAWNRFGNIQGSWGDQLPMEWINSQFELQKNITTRMLELGMTPVLPCFTGFVPRAITRVLPNATVVNGSTWNDFPIVYTNVTFLEPEDPAFKQLQVSYISKQQQALGNISHIYTLDQYNENEPFENSTEYLRGISNTTMESLKAADPDAIWLMQGWLFLSSASFWTAPNVEAYLGGVSDNNDMLILDLFSESVPMWSNARVNQYYGKPWIWCQLHNFGGNMGLYGQIENVTINPIEALAVSSSMVGLGLTMEGQEGNEVMYDLLLDQAWSASPIETKAYFANWVTRRYAGNGSIPNDLYTSWDFMRSTVYNNTNASIVATTKSIIELSPNISGILGLPGHHPTILAYDPSVLESAWRLMYNAASSNPSLWDNPAFEYDIVDVTRQVLSNRFISIYTSIVSTYTVSQNTTLLSQNLTSLLNTLDEVLLTNPSFSLSTWLNAARLQSSNVILQDFYEYDARNQITLWGPDGEISDYASKSWGGLVSGYYLPRWQIFVEYLEEVPVGSYNETVLRERLALFENGWQNQTVTVEQKTAVKGSLQNLIQELMG